MTCENGVLVCRDVVAEMRHNGVRMAIAYVGICHIVVIVVWAVINMRA